MNVQPICEIKARLEQAAIAGTGLLGEDFRLARAAETLKPMAAASPVFAKIDKGLQELLTAPAGERGGRLLDLLALVDAVLYTQAQTGASGEWSALPKGGGVHRQLSYGQLNPLLTALTTTGGGRMEIVRDAWAAHPEWFTDYRILPAVVSGLGDSYAELAAICGNILRAAGAPALPLLYQDFDPAGKKDMARRVGVIAAIEGENAGIWLREILPKAKKDVRAAVITALGRMADSTPLLLELAQTEKAANRDAVLGALARQDGEPVRAFWEQELEKDGSAVKFLQPSQKEWAAALVTSGLRARLERYLPAAKKPTYEESTDVTTWCWALGTKDTPSALAFWRWADSHMEEIDRIESDGGHPVFWGVKLTDALRESVCACGPGPLRDFCLTLWERHPVMTRYLIVSFQAALLSCPAAEVYERFAACIPTQEPEGEAEREAARTVQTVFLRAIGAVTWDEGQKTHVIDGGRPILEPLDPRWVTRFTHAVWPATGQTANCSPIVYWEKVDGFDVILTRIADPSNEQIRAQMAPYLRGRMEKYGSAYTYTRWLLKFGGSPRDVLGKALAKNVNANRGYVVWELMYAIWQARPVEEVIALLQEIRSVKFGHPKAVEQMEKAIPYAIAQLQAGNPFPSASDWTRGSAP